jgi:hypothetical protein
MTKIIVAFRNFANAPNTGAVDNLVSVFVIFPRHAAAYPTALASSRWPGNELKKGPCLFTGYIP